MLRCPWIVALPVRSAAAFAGFRVPPEVIILAVRWYLRFGLSYRDVEELLTERGMESGRKWGSELDPVARTPAVWGQ